MIVHLVDGTCELFRCYYGSAAYGMDPVLITRRGRKIAAVVSMHDLALLVQMRLRRGSR